MRKERKGSEAKKKKNSFSKNVTLRYTRIARLLLHEIYDPDFHFEIEISPLYKQQERSVFLRQRKWEKEREREIENKRKTRKSFMHR